MGFSETDSRKKRPISLEKIWDKFRRKTIVEKSQFRGNFLGQFSWKDISFALISRTFFMKQNDSFAIFLTGEGGRGGMMSVSPCNNNNNRNIEDL